MPPDLSISPNPADELRLLLQSGQGLVVIETPEESRAVRVALDAAVSEGRYCYLWSSLRGLVGLNGSELTAEQAGKTTEPLDAVRPLLEHAPGWVAIFADALEALKDAPFRRAVRELADHGISNRGTVILIGPVVDTPLELQRLATHLPLPLPDAGRFEELIRRVYRDLAARHHDITAEITQSQLTSIAEALIGTTESEAERLIAQVILRDRRLAGHDIEEIRKRRRLAAASQGKLESLSTTDDLNSLGGLDNLKRWLRQRHAAMDHRAVEFGLTPPRGILLLGVPGCGKSLCAKLIAGEWKRPLLRLDTGALYNKYVGASETNLRESLRQAEAAAPCVLWIDEIEKAFASVTGEAIDGGVSQRLFATMLSWMNDRTADVFMVATANDVARLPAELLRKGRFDEIFFVDLPAPEARKRILEIHLVRRRREPAKFDLDRLAEIAEGFAGSEIEQAIVSGLHDAFEHKAEINTVHIATAMKRTRPLSVIMAEKIDALRRWADGRCVMAD